jgi:hypothetical protein
MSDKRQGISFPLRKLVILFLACAGTLPVGVLGCRPRTIAAQSAAKLWSIDLGSDRDFHERLAIPEVLLDPPTINFLNDGDLICGFYSGAKVGTGDEKVSGGYHVLEIAASDGSLGKKLVFDAFESEYQTLPVADGGFIVFVGDRLKKYNDRFEPGPDYPTPREGGGRFDRWRVGVSPTADFVVLYSRSHGDTQAALTWLRATDLASTRTISVQPAAAFEASDTAAIVAGIGNEQLLSAGKNTMLCARCRAHFLTDELLFLDKGNSYSLETLSGKSLGTGVLDIQAQKLSRARHTQRFAYVTGHYVGNGLPLQTHFDSITGKIMVVDSNTNRPIAEIDINEPAGNPSAGLNQMALALSSDGKYLAALLHHTLSLYRLP